MRIIAAFGASLAFALSVTAALHGFADLAAGSARAWMREWQRHGQVTSNEQWSTAFDRLRLAHRLNPLNADYSADLGRLSEWYSWLDATTTRQYDVSRAIASDFYLESISRRPSWGFAWAQYAENQMLRGITGTDFEMALLRSIELAPWEPGVQRKVAFTGMAVWHSLSPGLREQVRSSIGHAVQLDVHRHEIVRLAVQYGWLDNLIPLMRGERQIATLNSVLEKTERR